MSPPGPPGPEHYPVINLALLACTPAWSPHAAAFYRTYKEQDSIGSGSPTPPPAYFYTNPKSKGWKKNFDKDLYIHPSATLSRLILSLSLSFSPFPSSLHLALTESEPFRDEILQFSIRSPRIREFHVGSEGLQRRWSVMTASPILSSMMLILFSHLFSHLLWSWCTFFLHFPPRFLTHWFQN